MITVQLTLLLLSFIVANLPWFSERLFYIVPLKAERKSLAWCLFELIVLYSLTGALTAYAEYAVYGQMSKQGWEFYTITFSLFLVFAFPGFVYKTLWVKR